jgi:hypothetical protein
MDISEGTTPIASLSTSSESKKRKLTKSVLYNASGELERGRISGPRKRRQSSYEVENMRGRTKQRAVGGPHRAERKSTRSTRRR